MGMPDLLTRRAADEALDVKLAARRLSRIVDRALEDGVVTPEEAAEMRRLARQVQREADEAEFWSKEAYNADAAGDTLRRGGALDPTPFKRERLRAARVDVIETDVLIEDYGNENAASAAD